MAKKSSPAGKSHVSRSRDQTTFYLSRFFDDSIEELAGRNSVVRIQVLADVDAFKQAWKNSQPGDRLPERFQFKELVKVGGTYRVCQIYVARGNYRTGLLFVHDNTRAYLLDVFKKTKKVNKHEVDKIIDHAAKVWESAGSGQPGT